MYGGDGNISEIQMAARSARSWNFSQYFGLFQWEKIIFCQNAYFCLKMIFRQCYFYFFSPFASGVGGFWKVWKIPLFFETFPKINFQTMMGTKSSTKFIGYNNVNHLWLIFHLKHAIHQLNSKVRLRALLFIIHIAHLSTLNDLPYCQ